MRTIHKYLMPLPGNRRSNTIPANVGIVHVGIQAGDAFAWGEIDTDAKPETYEFYCIGTGQHTPIAAHHIGTVIDAAGFVWHYYMKRVG